MKIIFSKNAIKSLTEIRDFLTKRWTEKEFKIFNNDFQKFIISFEDKIISHPKVESHEDLQFALLGKKQIKVYFTAKSDTVEILLFFPSKGNPESLKKFLNQ